LSPARFVREILKFKPDPWQEQVLESTKKQILLNCSRQSGKSTTTGAKALHKALFFDNTLTLLVSPSLRQSAELFKKITGFLKRVKNPPHLIEDNKLSLTFDTGSRIVSLPSSEDTIRGFSAVDLIIMDEASRIDDNLYRSIRPMLAVSQGQLIVMSTPFGKRGFFHSEWTEGDNWEKILVKATDCPRISSEFLANERKSLGDWWFKQEYMCEFVETTDSVFSYEMVMQSLSNDVKPLPINDNELTDDKIVLFDVK
jgi:hypothetical protein